jgi:opacity protein-like surface antigen
MDRDRGTDSHLAVRIVQSDAGLDWTKYNRGGEDKMKLRIGILAGALMLIASSAFAGMQWVALNGGAGIPSGDLSDGAETGWLIGGSYGYMLNDKFALGAIVNYNAFGKKTVATVDVEPKILQYTAQGYYMLPMGTAGTQFPYLMGGLGMYNVDTDVTGIDSKSLFGANAGLGWNKVLNAKTSFGIDGLYHWISQSDDFKKANGDKASLGYFQLSAHVGWAFGGNATASAK